MHTRIYDIFIMIILFLFIVDEAADKYLCSNPNLYLPF